MFLRSWYHSNRLHGVTAEIYMFTGMTARILHMFLVSIVRAVYFSGHDLTDFTTKHEVTDQLQATEYEDHSNMFLSVPGMQHFCSPQHFVFKYLQPLSFLQKQRGDCAHKIKGQNYKF